MDNIDKDNERFIWPSAQKAPITNQAMFDNLKKLLENNISKINHDFIEDVKNNGAPVNAFDQIILSCLISQYGIKTATEIGLGSTTTNMVKMGVKVTSFALDDRREDPRGDFIHINKNLLEKETKELFSISLASSEFLLIDGVHSFNFAENYSPLLTTSIPLIFIHDHYNPLRPTVTGEQWFVDNKIRDKYDVLFYSDILGYLSKEHRQELFNIIGWDFSYQILEEDEWNLPYQDKLDGPAMKDKPQPYGRGWCPICCIILVKKT